MLEVPKWSQVFLPGHGWSRLVTGGHGSVPLYLVLGVSPRSRLVTGGHGLFLERKTKKFRTVCLMDP